METISKLIGLLTLVALAAMKGDKTLADLARQYDIGPNQIIDWKMQLLERAAQVFDGGAKAESGPDLKLPRAKIGQPAESVLGGGQHLHSDAPGLRLPGCGGGSILPQGVGLATVEHTDDRLMSGDGQGGDLPLRQAGAAVDNRLPQESTYNRTKPVQTCGAASIFTGYGWPTQAISSRHSDGKVV